MPWCTWGAICSPLLQQCHPHQETQTWLLVRRTTKQGQISYAQVRRKGAPPLSATFTRLADAKKWVQITEAAIVEGRHFKTAEAKRHTLADMIDRYRRDILPAKARDPAESKASNCSGGVGS